MHREAWFGNLANRLLKLSPVLAMCAIFSLQLWAATWSNLTPWKGGGFGMFSTCDSPDARFIRAEGITKAGERVRIAGLSESSRMDFLLACQFKSCLAKPRSQILSALSQRLLDLQFVSTTVGFDQSLEKFGARNTTAAKSLPTLGDPGIRVVRPFDAERLGHQQANGEKLQAITIQVWRECYDRRQATLAAEVMCEASAVDRS